MAHLKRREGKKGISYLVTVSDGFSADGRQNLKYATFRYDPNRTEKQNYKMLQEFALEFERKIKNGYTMDGSRMTFSDMVNMWFSEYAARELEKTTIENYHIILDTHVLPEIGKMILNKIKPLHLEKLFNKMAAERKDGKPGGYSNRTIQYTYVIISRIYSTAEKWGVITPAENPISRTAAPKNHGSRENNYFTPEQTAAFLEYVNKRFIGLPAPEFQFAVMYNLLIFCGMRRGELIALTWEDIDLNNNRIHINKSAARLSGQTVIKSPKNDSSIRFVSYPAAIAGMMHEYRKAWITYRFQVGKKWKGKDNIFIRADGSPMSLYTPNGNFQTLIRNFNKREKKPLILPEITLHGLRHTSATLAIYNNIDVRTVSGRLGHAKTSTTTNIYAHFIESADKAAADTLGDAIYKAVEKAT